MVTRKVYDAGLIDFDFTNLILVYYLYVSTKYILTILYFSDTIVTWFSIFIDSLNDYMFCSSLYLNNFQFIITKPFHTGWTNSTISINLSVHGRIFSVVPTEQIGITPDPKLLILIDTNNHATKVAFD